MMDERSPEVVLAHAPLVNVLGLHARASLKLTQLARDLGASVEIALSADGPWVDARSPSRLMRIGARRGAVLHSRASGSDAEVAVDAVLALVRDGFGEWPTAGAVSGA